MQKAAKEAGTLSVIVPVYSRDAYLSEMLEKLFLPGIRANCPPGTELVIVDDCSPLKAETAALAAAAGEWADVKFLRNTENLGYLRSINAGLNLATGRRLLLCNSDTRLAPGALDRLEAALDSEPRLGIAGPVSNGAYNSVMQAAAGLPEPLKSFAPEELARFDAYGAALAARRLPRAEAGWLLGFCTLMKREVLGDVGLFDEGFGFGYLEELDYAIRARRAGWKLAVVPDAFVFHGGLRKGLQFAGANAGSQTGRAAPVKTFFRIMKGLSYLKKKYGKEVVGIPQDAEGAAKKGF
ncbi:MAG: glycosyltransferase family 2 protein [Elusimicrobiales bacterium]|nr:glycosyltransferase family 2 protein [Elusimicrobiales bacterium]